MLKNVADVGIFLFAKIFQCRLKSTKYFFWADSRDHTIATVKDTNMSRHVVSSNWFALVFKTLFYYLTSRPYEAAAEVVLVVFADFCSDTLLYVSYWAHSLLKKVFFHTG